DGQFPLLLNSGRLRDQWHGMSRTGGVAQLYGHAPEPALGLSPTDLAARNLDDGQLVRVSSRRGTLVVPVQADTGLRPGQAWLPMHWGNRFLTGLGSNRLTQPGHDPLSHQPELKLSAIDIAPVHLPWRLYALVEGMGLADLDRLRPLLEVFPYASLGLICRERRALVLRAAALCAPGAERLGALVVRAASRADPGAEGVAALDARQGLTAPGLRYEEAARGISKRMRLDGARLTALRLAGESRSLRGWPDSWRKGTLAEIPPRL